MGTAVMSRTKTATRGGLTQRINSDIQRDWGETVE